MLSPPTKSKLPRALASRNFDAARLARLDQVAEMLLRGISKAKIAKALGIGDSSVAYDAKILHELWIQDAVERADEWKARLIKQQEWRIREAAAAWDRSRQPKQSRRVKTGGKGGDEIVETEENQAGDPRFLDQIGGACQEIAKLTGAYAPVQHRVVDDSGQDALSRLRKNLSVAELRVFTNAFKTLEMQKLEAKAIDAESSPVSGNGNGSVDGRDGEQPDTEPSGPEPA